MSQVADGELRPARHTHLNITRGWRAYVLHIASPGKDQKSKLEVWFLPNAYYFHTIMKWKNVSATFLSLLSPAVPTLFFPLCLQPLPCDPVLNLGSALPLRGGVADFILQWIGLGGEGKSERLHPSHRRPGGERCPFLTLRDLQGGGLAAEGGPCPLSL